MARQLNIAFLGCGFITGVHSRSLARLREDITPSYASRNIEQARGLFSSNTVVSGVTAITERLWMIQRLTLLLSPCLRTYIYRSPWRALAAKKHVLVEKPAFPCLALILSACQDRGGTQAGRVVLVGENDHYKPLAVCLRRLLADGAIGEMVLAHFTTLVKKFKSADDWRNDEVIAGGDAFFEEGIHWLHLANSLGPKIVFGAWISSACDASPHFRSTCEEHVSVVFVR